MTHESKWKLPSRLFTLLVLCFALMVCADGNFIRHAEASDLEDFANCANNFGSSATMCANAYNQCLATCSPGTCGQCGAIQASCFGDSIHGYSNCLQELDYGLDTCAAAEEAWGGCINTYNLCINKAETPAQEMDCAGTRFECRDHTGIDFCQ